MSDTVGMAEAFEWVLIAVVVVGVAVAIASIFLTRGSHDHIGRGGLSLDQPDRIPGPARGSAAASAEARAEIRQMVEAKSARRVARGEAPLDVDAEIAALTRPPEVVRDDALRQEVRDLVIAGNERRVRRGEAPLDVEAEVERQLREFG